MPKILNLGAVFEHTSSDDWQKIASATIGLTVNLMKNKDDIYLDMELS